MSSEEEWVSSYRIAFLLMLLTAAVSLFILGYLLHLVPYRGDVLMARFSSTLPDDYPLKQELTDRVLNRRPFVEASLWIVTDTMMDPEAIVLSISDYCSIRGATSQTLLTAFGNIFSCIGIQAAICKICDEQVGSHTFNALLCYIFGLFGAFLLVNFEVNNQTSLDKRIVLFKTNLHMIGCFAFIILVPYGFGMYKQWDALSIILLVIAYLSFGIYVVGPALLEINKQYLPPRWKNDFFNDRIDLGMEDDDDDDDDGDGNGNTNNNGGSNESNSDGKELKTLLEMQDKKNNYGSNDFRSRGKYAVRKSCKAVRDGTFATKETHRQRCSYFFCLTELVAVVAGGVAALTFVYQM